ncbi:unnamed protein product [Nezara viridula]|uniref:Uncharacterized protein n=1 Tax=Nezara viridula TaxID=85310 RepID=A0A9P0H311_NEZVI|nr:unnamed protein product [Nezara viridula]
MKIRPRGNRPRPGHHLQLLLVYRNSFMSAAATLSSPRISQYIYITNPTPRCEAENPDAENIMQLVICRGLWERGWANKALAGFRGRGAGPNRFC